MIQVSGTLANGSPTHKIIDKVVPVGELAFAWTRIGTSATRSSLRVPVHKTGSTLSE